MTASVCVGDYPVISWAHLAIPSPIVPNSAFACSGDSMRYRSVRSTGFSEQASSGGV
jgi:hypothetical protein